MADSAKASILPHYCREATWLPLPDWWEISFISNQHFGLPPLLEPFVSGRLAASSWPGYLCSHPAMAYGHFPMQPKLQREIAGGVSEMKTGVHKWKISLDVNHFSPTELSIRTVQGFLEVSGKHEERRDEHGFISRSFTRKYQLPDGLDPQIISCTLSGDGVLSVEAALPKVSAQPDVIIPIQVEKELVSAAAGEAGGLRTGEGAEMGIQDLKPAEGEAPHTLPEHVQGIPDELALHQDFKPQVSLQETVPGTPGEGRDFSQVGKEDDKETPEQVPEEESSEEPEASETPDTVTLEQEEISGEVQAGLQEEDKFTVGAQEQDLLQVGTSEEDLPGQESVQSQEPQRPDFNIQSQPSEQQMVTM
ncbi:heat shock protein beta-1 [Denticeps clupeoides]|uniref:SHSP domain-containing protein n=1 Tax=Denticeps clupeoides TaxID=299321 RepID=A0AAY4C8Z8_9TELE|nr:heat shock protein beta-1-like [Denticeps clupeoides]